VHTALFSILAGGAEIEPHRGSAAGVIRFHYPLIVPTEPEKCWIEIGGHHFFWEEGVPLCSTTRASTGFKNQTEETRVVLIIDFNAEMPFPVNLYTSLRYNLIRRSAEIKAVIERAAIGVPPRDKAAVAPDLAKRRSPLMIPPRHTGEVPRHTGRRGRPHSNLENFRSEIGRHLVCRSPLRLRPPPP